MAYKRIRARLILSAVPQLELAQDPQWSWTVYDLASSLLMRGVITRMTTIRAIGLRTATRLKLCQRRVKKRDFSAVPELLGEEPWYVYHPWVQKTLRRFGDHPRFHRKRGRPRGKHQMDPLALVGLVDCLVESGKARSRAMAFGLIEDWGLMKEGTAKRLYRRADTDTTPRGVLIEFPDEEQYVSEKEVRAVLASTQSSKPHTEIRRVLHDTESSPVEIRIEGGTLEAPTCDFFLVESVSVKVSGAITTKLLSTNTGWRKKR